MSDITIPLDEITIDDLDIDRVYGIAKKELSDTADEKWNPFDKFSRHVHARRLVPRHVF